MLSFLSGRRWRSRIFPALTLAILLSLVAFPALVAYAATPLQISSDPFTQATCKASATTNHHTEVEPDTFSNGSTIVAAFQVGRVSDGGSCDIGFATSANNGGTWANGLLPGTTHFATPAGPYDRISDPSVAFDASHGKWLIASLALTGASGAAVLVSQSTTTSGTAWNNPVVVNATTGVDKNWIACDNTSTSPFFGHCYVEWDNNAAGNLLQMSTSSDGGTTWSAPATNNTGVIGGQPVVRPDGTVIVPIDNANETAIGAFNSTNGGASWSAVTTIAAIKHHTVAGGLRESALPSAEIDQTGTVYVVWSDSRFRRGGKTNDIVISHSLNSTGTSWSSVSRVPIDATNSGIDHFIPGLAVNKATSGGTAQLGLTYYFYPSGSTQLSVGFISSTNAGSTWSTPQTIASGMPTGWLATTTQGRMVGDYISTSYGSDNLAHGVFATASAPTSGTNCSDVPDNCVEPMDTFSTGLAASGSASSAGDPVVFGGGGGGNGNLWKVDFNNGKKHR
jgi:BNR repeat-like domain